MNAWAGAREATYLRAALCFEQDLRRRCSTEPLGCEFVLQRVDDGGWLGFDPVGRTFARAGEAGGT
jgi:hypothetical protein